MADKDPLEHSASFSEDFSRLFSEAGWRRVISPAEALRRWKDFADDCLAGFPWDTDDYNNDLTLRTLLAEILPALEAAGHGAAQQLTGEIEAIDSKVRTVLQRESFPSFPEHQWWLRRSPKYACRKFCAEFHEAYGVKVEPRSLFDDDVKEMIHLGSTGMPVSNVLIYARDRGLYVSTRPGLLIRAFREAFPAMREKGKLVLRWVSGDAEDSELCSSLTER